MTTPMAPDAALESARRKMIEQQIRTWDVLSLDVLGTLEVVRRELFVPEPYRALAFVDTEVPLVVAGEETGETMLPPRVEARILQEIDLHAGDTVLEVGTGSGYMAALLASKASQVVTVEIDPRLQAFAKANLAKTGVNNVRVELGNGIPGWPLAGPVDVLVVSGSLPFIPQTLLDQVKVGGRIVAFVGDAPAMACEIRHRTGPQTWTQVTVFETVVKRLREAPQVSRFSF